MTTYHGNGEGPEADLVEVAAKVFGILLALGLIAVLLALVFFKHEPHPSMDHAPKIQDVPCSIKGVPGFYVAHGSKPVTECIPCAAVPGRCGFLKEKP